MRRPRHIMLFAVLALQILAAPALIASSAVAHPTTASSHCLDQMGQGDDPCPCCPKGFMVPGCMSLCTVFSVNFDVALPAVLPVTNDSIPFDPLPVSTQTYAPPNPPPIC